MSNSLVISLAVTGIGMLVLFLALAILCGLMYLMTGLIKDRPEREEDEDFRSFGKLRKSEEAQQAARRQAAVIAIALARAEGESSTASVPGTEGPVSAWRALHHQRQLALNPPRKRL